MKTLLADSRALKTSARCPAVQHASDLPKLVEGLKRLSKSDPMVLCSSEGEPSDSESSESEPSDSELSVDESSSYVEEEEEESSDSDVEMHVRGEREPVAGEHAPTL